MEKELELSFKQWLKKEGIKIKNATQSNYEDFMYYKFMNMINKLYLKNHWE